MEAFIWTGSGSSGINNKLNKLKRTSVRLKHNDEPDYTDGINT